MTVEELTDLYIANIKFLRIQRKMSQDRLSELADISPSFLSDIENGKKFGSFETFAKIANALDVEPYELLLPSNKTISYDSRKTKELMRQLHKNLDDAVSTLERFLTAEK